VAALHLRRALAGALALAALSAPALVAAQSDADRKEARERFDRGLRLFNQGDTGGALAEFRRAHELTAHPLVLYNIALVHAAAGRPVQAVEALDELLANPGGLDAARVEKAKQTRAEQAARIGLIEVKANVDGAAIEVDAVEVAKTPLAKPLQVSSGSHIVGVVAPGYIPVRREVVVAGGQTVPAEFELERVEGKLALITVKTRVPDADVLVDGQVVGTTPLPASLAIAPGQHTIELRRPGYATVKEQVNLGSGASGEVTLEPRVDQAALSTEGGMLALQISEPDSVVFVNGEPRGTYRQPIQLPAGRHLIRVERAEFFPFSREVVVPKNGATDVRVDLQPTPEKRAAYVSGAKSQITWGWVAVGGGALVAGGAAGFLIWNYGEESDAKDEHAAVQARCEAEAASGGGASDVCLVELGLKIDKLDSIRGREKFGWIGGGVGIVAIGTGIFLLATADDPDRYEPKEESDVFGRVRVVPTGWVTAGGGGFGLTGAF
jgi:hypothetical protein